MNRRQEKSARLGRIPLKLAIAGCLSVLWLYVATQCCPAQLTTTGTIAGTVVDQSGAAVPGAAVSVTNLGTGAVAHTVSNSDGKYSEVGLPSGNYEVTVSGSGFSGFKETHIYLEPAAVYTVNVTLKPGTLSSTVTVEANAAAVQTITPEISNTVSGAEAEELPLNGRNYEGLAQLMPGVVNTSPDTALGIGGFATSNYMNVNGGGSSGTFYTLDGIWNENTGNMTQTTITPVPDEIDEIKVLQNNYDPKYSLMGASVVVVQTKSGTSTFHGGAWEFLRNTALDTRNFFVVPPTPISPEEWNIFGWHVGGPVFIPHLYNTSKQKTFFYWNQQWVRQKQEGIVTGESPLATMRGIGTPNGEGLFPMTGIYGTAYLKDPTLSGSCSASSKAACFGTDGNGNYVIPANRINPSQLAFLNALAVLPNYSTANTTNYENTKPAITKQLDEEGKIDHYITPKFRLTGELFYEGQNAYNPNASRMGSPYSTNYDLFLSDNKLAQVQLTQVYSPSMTNQTSIAMNNYVITHDFAGVISGSQIPGYSANFPYSGGYLENRLPHVTFSNGWSQFGTSANNTIPDATDLEDTIADDWSWVRGKHFIEAGGELVFGTKRQWSTVANTTGDVSFSGYATNNPVADYLLGDAATFAQGDGGVRKYIHYTIFTPYVEDRWSATQRLTMTIGLRFFRMPFPGSQAGYSANFNPALFNPAAVPTVSAAGNLSGPYALNYANGIEVNGQNGIPLNITNQHNYYVAPMVGLALDVFGNGKTSVRGGFGVAYNRNGGMGNACSQNCVSYPVLTQTNLIDVNYPNITGGTAAPITAPGVSGMPKDYQVAKIETWSASVQQQFPGNWLFTLAGVGDIADHMATSYNLNAPPPVNGYNFNPNLNTSGYAAAYYAPYVGYGTITWYNPIGVDNWNALEVSLRHPVGHHLYTTVAYTWSHNLDNAGGFQNLYNLQAAYGNSTLNTPQVFTASVVYTLPIFESGWKHAVLGGWKYSDMTTIQTGTSATFGITGSNLGPITQPNRVATVTYPKNWKAYKYGSNAFWFNPGTTANPVFARPANGFYGNGENGTEMGPGTAVYNMAAYKDFQLQERVRLQFRAEYFNVFNHTNPNGPGLTFGSGTFGVVTSAKDPRIGEMALKIFF
jgi:Carboxypeptidase regulatory-like domain